MYQKSPLDLPSFARLLLDREYCVTFGASSCHISLQINKVVLLYCDFRSSIRFRIHLSFTALGGPVSTLQNVTCDNCSASYSINFSKLKREKNRITCRRCQHKIVFYKSRFVEPANEQAVVDHADEKTLVEENQDPNAQRGIDKEPMTAVSTNTPPMVPSTLSQELSDPTIRRNVPPPVRKPELSIAKSNPYSKLEEDLVSKSSKSISGADVLKSPSKSGSRRKDPLGLRGTLQLCTGMMALGILSMLGMQFSTGLVSEVAFVLGTSSLTMGGLWLLTSDFGFVKPNMGLSISGASVVAMATGALIFAASDPIDTTGAQEYQEDKELTVPSVDVVEAGRNPDKIASKTLGDKEKTKDQQSASKKSMGSSTATVRDAEKSNQARKEMLAAANDYMKSKDEPEYDLDDPSDEAPRKPVPTDPTPIADPDEGLDADMGFDEFEDLGLDKAAEDKKGLFGRKEKSDKPVPKATAAADIKVDIPTSVLDIIIRNNKNVKGCYVQQRSETGTFPKSIDVMFTLQPHGKVSSAYIASGPYVGSKFEGCIRAAFKSMTFPPFDSNAKPQTLKYALKL